LLFYPCSFFIRGSIFAEETLFVGIFFLDNHLICRIKVETRNEKGCNMYGVCGMHGEVECALFNVNEILPSMIWWRIEKSKINEGMNQPR
jgi:hypothetical protein